MKRLALNFGVVKKARLFGLAVMAIILGSSELTWGQKNSTFTSSRDGDWHNPSIWTQSVTGHFPGEVIYDNGNWGKYGSGIVTVSHKITMGDMSSYSAGRTKASGSVYTDVFDIQKLTLNAGAELTLNNDLYINGSGQSDCYNYNGGKLTINEGHKLLVEKNFNLNADQIIDGEGTIRIGRVINGKNHTLTANVNVDINVGDDGNASSAIDKLKLVANKSVTINRNNDLSFIDLTINEGGSFKTNYNKTITVKNNLVLNGGTLDIAAGTVKVTSEARVLTVTGDAVLKGTGTLDVAKINIAGGATLTINDNRTFDGIAFTGAGALKVADGVTLTLNNTTFSNDITILKGETGTGQLVISGNLAGGTNSTLTTEVNTTLQAVGNFSGITTINVAGGTFNNFREISEMANIAVADGATLTTRSIDVTNTLDLEGSLTGNSAITFTGTAATFGANTSIASGSFLGINSNSTISGLASCLDGRAEIQANKDITYESSTHVLAADYNKLTVNGGDVTLCGTSTVADEFTTEDNVTISGQNITLNGAISGGKSITVNGITMTVGGSGAAAAQFAVTGSGTLTYNRSNALADLSVAAGSTVEFGATTTVTDPTLQGTVSVGSGETLTIGGDITFGSGTVVSAGSNVVIADGSTINGLAGCIGVSFANGSSFAYGAESTYILVGNYTDLTVNSSSAKLCGSVTVTGLFTANNDITISKDANESLTLSGAIAGGKQITANGIALEVDGTGGVDAQIALTGGAQLTYSRAENFSGLTVGNGCEADFEVSTTLTNSTLEGNVNVKSGEILTLGGDINFGTSTTLGGEGRVLLASNSTVANLKTCLDVVVESLANISYDASSTKIISHTYDNIEINGDVELCNDVVVNGTLTWNAGNITLAGHNLTLANAIAGNTTFGPNHMVVVGSNGATAGTLTFNNLCSNLFPVGTTQDNVMQYSPISIVSGVSKVDAGALASISVTSANAIVSGGSVLNLKRWWDISAVNISATDAALTFIYDDSDSDTELFSAMTIDGAVVTSNYDAASNRIDALEVDNIVGQWTAVDNGKVFYSRIGGATTNWSAATTWTTNEDGSDSGNTGLPTANDNVVILANTDVTIDISDAVAKSVRIDGSLDYGTATPAFRFVYGTGTLKVDGVQEFSKNSTRDYTQFMSDEGGTVELRGDFSGQTEWEFNNLVLNNTIGVTSVTPDNAAIVGNLTLTGANLAFAGTEPISVGGNIIIGANHTLTFGSARTVSAAAIDASASGAGVSVGENVTIDGSVKLLGNFDVADEKTLTLGGTEAESNATIEGAGNAIMANNAELSGTLVINNMELNSAVAIAGNVTATNLYFGSGGASVSGTGKLVVTDEFSPYQINTTVANFELRGDERSPEATIVVDGGVLTVYRLTQSGTKFSNLTVNNDGKVVLQVKSFLESLSMNGNAQLLATGETTIGNSKLSGSVVNSSNATLGLKGSLNFDGIGTFNGKYKANINLTISNLHPAACLSGYEFDASDKSVEYDENSTYILTGDYGNLTIRSTDVTICGDITVKNFAPTKNGNGPFTITGNSYNFVVTESISGGKYLTFNGVNPTFGVDGGAASINVKQITVNSPNQLTIIGNVTTNSNHLAFAGNGDIVINSGSVFTIDNKDLTFNNNQTIRGEGKLVVGTGLIASGKTLTTFASVEVGTDATTINVGELVVNGGTFTYNNTKTLNELTVNSGATFAAAASTTVKEMSVNAGTVTIANGANLTVSTTALQVSGNTTITSVGISNILASNVELAEGANLTINNGITINNALVVNNDATITGGAEATLAWATPEACKISTASGKTLSLTGALGIASDITIDGALSVIGNLNLGGANVTFTDATNFAGTTGNINFSGADITINNLKVDPQAPAESVHFNPAGKVTYAATCSSMLPGTYNDLIINTETKKNISLFDDVTVNGSLTWAAGRIALSGSKLTVSGTFSGNYTSDHMVIMSGNSQLAYQNNTGSAVSGLELKMPVGTFSTTSMGEAQYYYSPATLSDLSEIASNGYVAVSVKGEALRGTTSDLVRYWTISSSNADMTGSLAFTYDDADDINGYGTSEKNYWSVLHKVGDTDIHDESNHSPYNDNTINIASGKICGVWTAIEYPEVVTLYSYNTGDWGVSTTWTLISTGSVYENPTGRVPGPKTDVIILQGHEISTGELTGISARSVLLKTESSKLNIEKKCASDEIEINDLSGVGVLRIEGRGDFPSGILHPNKFMAADGGTTEFYGTPATNPFTLLQDEFNNLKINFATSGIVMQLPGNGAHQLNINGKLTIENGILEFTKNGQIINVNKGIDIESNGVIRIHNDVKGGNKNTFVTLQVGGDLINNGNLILTRRGNAAFTAAESRKDEANYGRGILHFTGAANARFECLNTTQISQLIVDKGSDQTYVLTLFADNREHFALTGRANEQATDNAGTGYGNSVPDNPDKIYKPLWLKNGTLELTGDVLIKTLSEGGNDNAFIPLNGCLHLNGDNVEVDVCFDGTNDKCLMPAGKVIVERGLLDCKTGAGIVFRNTSEVEIKGGKLRGSQFRPSQYATNGKTTFIISGGEVVFDGKGEMKNAYSTFYMPFSTFTFKMSGGLLDVYSAQNNNGGAFVVNCNPDNSNIEGGEIRINAADAQNNNGTTYTMISSIPLYNLTLTNADALPYTHIYKNFKGSVNNVSVNVTPEKLYVKNNLTIGSNVNFEIGDGKDVEVGGNLVIESGATVKTTHGDIMFNGGGDLQQLSVAGAIKSGATNTDDGFYSITVDEDSKLQVNNNITVNNKFTLASGSELHDGVDNNIYTMNGDVIIDGTHKKRSAGAAKMVLKSTNIYSSGTGVLQNVEIDNGDRELKLLDPYSEGRQTKLTINGRLNFASESHFNIGGSNLEFGDAATVTPGDGEFNELRMIQTVGSSSLGVTKVYSDAARKFTFPFGFKLAGTSYYTPATISYMSASTYGSVTTRPVSGYAFRTPESLNCYWISEDRGFEDAGGLTQTYYWYGDGLGEATPEWRGGRHLGATWDLHETTVSVGAGANADERYIQFSYNDVKSVNGNYSCGLIVDFINGGALYSATNGDWSTRGTWSTEGVGGEPCDAVPNENTIVVIGGDHTINLDANDLKCASLSIAEGSTLNIGGYTGFLPAIVEVDEAVGAGTLRISRASFPNNGINFEKFNGEFGGTVEYYGSGYTIPATPVNYCNLVINSSGDNATSAIHMPEANVTVFNDLTVKGGYALSANDANRTVTVNKNWNITDGGTFLMYSSGNKKFLQTYNVKGDVTVDAGATLSANGSTANDKINKLLIEGDMTVDGSFSAVSNNNKFDTEFVGSNDAYISGTASGSDFKFFTLTCNKSALDKKLILLTHNISSSDQNSLLTMTRGTFEVAISDAESVDLTKDVDLTIPGSACLSVVSGTANVCNFNHENQLKLSGHISISGGTLKVGRGESNHNSILYAADGLPSITITGGNLVVNGQISREPNQTTGSLVWNQTGGAVEVRGKDRNNTPTFAARGTFEILNEGEFHMSGGTITVKNGFGGDTYGDIYLFPKVGDCSGGTIIADCPNASLKLKTNIYLHDVEVKNLSALVAYNDVNFNKLTINNTGVYSAQGNQLTIREAFVNHNNQSDDPLNKVSQGFVPGSESQLTLFEGSDMTYEGIGNFATQFGMLKVDGNLSLVSGCSPIRVAGDLTQISGVVSDNGNTISLYGNLMYDGSFEGTGGIDFVRSDARQTIGGSGYGKIGTVVISNSNEVWLNTDLRISNNLILGSSLYINRSRVILEENANVVTKDGGDFDNTHMIRLNGEHEDHGVTKIVGTGASNFVIPIGISGHYTPATYNFASNVNVGASISVKTINSLHKNLSVKPSKWLNYYWVVKTEGFGDDTRSISERTANFSVQQTYTFTDGKVESEGENPGTLLPEYMYYGGETEYEWVDLTQTARVEDNNIVFDAFGHIAGDYTAGVVNAIQIYTGLPVLYTRKTEGRWENNEGVGNESWEYKDENGVWQPYTLAPAGNPIHIRPGHKIIMRSSQKAYCLFFDKEINGVPNDELGILDIGASIGCDFGHVVGVGHLRMEPDLNNNLFKMPAGDFEEFLNSPRSIIEFGGDANGQLPNSIVGHVSQPLQNVILSGSGVKTLTKEDGEYINGWMEIENGTTLNYGNTPVHIKGNWIDKNTTRSGFAPGSSNEKSLVEFCGSKEQKITLSNNSSSFWNLKISNPAGVKIESSDGISTANLTVGYKLIFNGGYVVGTDNSHLIIESAANTSGAGASAFVVGPLTKIMSKSGSSFVYPVGDTIVDNGVKKFEYASTELSSVSAAGQYTVTFHKDDKYNGATVLLPLNTASKSEYWTIGSNVSGAKAKLTLRASKTTLETINDDILDRLAITGSLSDGAGGYELHKINSSYIGGILPNAKVQTADAVTISAYEDYIIGFASTTARLIHPTMNVPEYTVSVCDGEGGDYDEDGNPDVVSIPVYFTGKGGPYNLGYKVTVDGVSKTENITITTGDESSGALTFTGNELGALFNKTEGFRPDGNNDPLSYKIELVSVSEGGVPGIPETENTASITVFYNAVPVISGAKYVGMEDERLYSVDATSKWCNGYLWETPDNKASFSVTDQANPTVTFAKGEKDGDSYQEYSVKLTATQTYTTTESKTCKRSATMNVNVMNRPQPDIHGDPDPITGNEFIACKASVSGASVPEEDKYKYRTEGNNTHSFVWTLSDPAAGTISNGDKNECTIVWNKDYAGGSVYLYVEETVTIDEHPIPTKVHRLITLRDNFEFENDDFTIPTAACDAALAEVRIANPRDLRFQLFGDNDESLSAETVIASGETLSTGVTMSVGAHQLKLKVSNGGCSRFTNAKTLNVRETPRIELASPVVSDDDMYIGNLAQIGWTKTSESDPVAYSFAYKDGMGYTSAKPNDAIGSMVSGRTVRIEVPRANNFAGQLTVSDAGGDNKVCSSSYDIAEHEISHDFLWKGQNSSDWDDEANWWAGEVPSGSQSAVVRTGKQIKVDASSDDVDIIMPIVANNSEVGNVKLESGSIEVGNGKVLTIKGNVNSAGEFKGKGTVEFSDGDHTVAGTGSFVNLTNSGTVTAANDIAVNGTLNNTGEFVGDGVVSMSGAKLEGEGSFNNITFNNNVDVVGNTTIYGKMVMNGVVTAQNQINIGEEGSMSGSSWVNGKVQKKWRDADMGYFDFKIGSIAHAAPVRVTPTSEGAEFTASYAYDGSKPAITDKELIGDLERVSAQETWNIDGNVPSLITLYWSDFSGVTTDDELYIAHKLSNGTWEKLDGEVLDNSITTRTPVSSYSPFTFGAKNPEPDINPLPVTFAAFTGRQDGNSVALEWTTLSEKDNDYFEIERSIDGVNYVTVGYVDGAGNSSKRIDYTFSDNAPEQGLLYYRLSQVDFDGTREYADKVVTVYYTGGELGNLVVVPNPTNGLFRVSASGSMAGGRIELLSQSGMVIRIIDISSFDATIDISDLPSGIYVLRFVTDTKVLQQKVVKY